MDASDYCGAPKKPQVIAIFTNNLLLINMFNSNISLEWNLLSCRFVFNASRENMKQ